MIREATSEDATAACGIVRRSIVALCARDHQRDAATLTAWLADKTPARFERLIRSREHVSMLAELSGTRVGFGALNRRGSISLLYVAPEARFRGVSKALLAGLERAAARAGVRRLALESSRTALRFYEDSGYTAAGPPVAGHGITRRYPMSRRLAPDTRETVHPV